MLKFISIPLFLLCTLATAWALKPDWTSSFREARGHQNWIRVTKKPYDVDFKQFFLCQIPPPTDELWSAGHIRGYLHVRVNGHGTPFMNLESLTAGKVFPVGSVILKEKFLDKEAQTLDSLGLMIKTAQGWKFGYVNGQGKTYRDQKELSHCQSCHKSASKTDFVFGTYLRNTNAPTFH